jgi:hypothetical protein
MMMKSVMPSILVASTETSPSSFSGITGSLILLLISPEITPTG